MKEQLGKTFYKIDLKRLRLFTLVSNQEILYFTYRVLSIVNPREFFDDFQRALTVDLIS